MSQRGGAVTGGRHTRYHVEVFFVSFAALLLEISYTRIVSFKLYYYFTYLVIGLALLGLGAGGVLTMVSSRVRQAGTALVMQWALVLGAISVGVGYAVIAWLPIRSMAIWDYGTGESLTNIVKLLVICLALFASFIAVGVVLATLFGRRSEQIGRLYFYDLVGAAIACAIVVPLMSSGGPPSIVFLSGAVLGLVGLRLAVADRSRLVAPAITVVALLGIGAVFPDVLPDVTVDDDKGDLGSVETTRWNPVFRVDVAPFFDRQLIYHDGLAGSVILQWDGDRASLDDFDFDEDPRAMPFDTLGAAPDNVMIIGAAGGHEVLASLAFEAGHIDAVELNPATHDLVTGDYADFAGRFFEQPAVNYVQADGRSFLSRSDEVYDLIWYPAPDSYAASNVAAAGAFVLSESYLYTSEAITETLDHLGPDGLLAAQFGELNYDVRANRTTRYVGTVRAALDDIGVDDPSAHVLVASTADPQFPSLRYSTVLVKRSPFTPEEVERFTGSTERVPGTRIEARPGWPLDNPVSEVVTLPDAELEDWYDGARYNLTPIDDDAPFFWNFTSFGDVVREFNDPLHPAFIDPEDAVGERVLVLLLIVAIVFAASFLLLPFVSVREVWAALPYKGRTAGYFVAIGLGFMFFEITLIQKLVLFLGYPTYSLTVTLASLLAFTGVGALLSRRHAGRAREAVPVLVPAIVVLTVLYLVALPKVTGALLDLPLAGRVVIAFIALAPLGVCLGMFMPLGVGTVAGMSKHPSEYVAWGWAVNGFGSVVGSVLTTLIAMVFGFNVVLVVGLITYVIALAILWTMTAQRPDAVAEAAPITEVIAVE